MENEIYSAPVLEVVYFGNGDTTGVSSSEPTGGGGIPLPDDNW